VAWVPKALFPIPGTHCGQIDFDGGWSQGFQAEEGSEVSNGEFGGGEGREIVFATKCLEVANPCPLIGSGRLSQ